MLLAWFATQFLLVLAAVHAMARPMWRRLLSVACLASALFLPFLMPAAPLPRALLATLSLLALVKVLRIARDPGHWPASLRTWHALAPFDVDRTTRVAPALDRRLLAWAALHAAIAIAALVALHLLPRALPLWMQGLRLLLGVAMVYAGMEAITESLRLGHRLAGIDVPALQDRPLASLSIREFWNTRWNRPVSGWLDDYVFKPIAARRGATVGLLAAFAASGVLHAWVFLAAAGWIAAISAGMFFAFQAIFILVESFVGIRQASTGRRRLWTLGLLGMSSPLFVDPVLRAFSV